MCLVRILLRYSADVNAEDNEGNTSTHVALQKDAASTVGIDTVSSLEDVSNSIISNL